MRSFVWGVVLLGCASADPGFGPSSPTAVSAPSAELPPVARALQEDPAPPPAPGGDMGHMGHGAMRREPTTPPAGSGMDHGDMGMSPSGAESHGTNDEREGGDE